MGKKNRVVIEICAGKHCARAGAKRIIKTAEAAIDESGCAEMVKFRVVGCQDRCDHCPNLDVDGRYQYAEISPELTHEIVLQHIQHGEPLAEFLYKSKKRKK